MARLESNKDIERPQVSDYPIAEGLLDLSNKLKARLEKKGKGAYASRHEVLGILEEEMLELKEAIRQDDDLGYVNYQDELLDVAVGALFGYICLKGRYIRP